MKKCVDIVIVNWNSGRFLKECIDSLRSSSLYILFNIIVVDNASSDHSLAFIEACDEYNDLIVLRNNKNMGFGAACNLGARRFQSEFILFLNPDARVQRHTVEKTLDFMRSGINSDVGVCGVQLIDGDEEISRSCARFPSFSMLLNSSLGFSRIFNGLGYQMFDWAHDCTTEVDHVIGAYYFIRRKLFSNLQGFDEDFFVYYEDLDLSRRVKLRGWKIVYIADINAYHVGGGSSENIKATRFFYSARSRLIFVSKHFSRSNFYIYLFNLVFFEFFMRLINSLLDFSGRRLFETLSGYCMLYKWILFKSFFNKS